MSLELVYRFGRLWMVSSDYENVPVLPDGEVPVSVEGHRRSAFGKGEGQETKDLTRGEDALRYGVSVDDDVFGGACFDLVDNGLDESACDETCAMKSAVGKGITAGRSRSVMGIDGCVRAGIPNDKGWTDTKVEWNDVDGEDDGGGDGEEPRGEGEATSRQAPGEGQRDEDQSGESVLGTGEAGQGS